MQLTTNPHASTAAVLLVMLMLRREGGCACAPANQSAILVADGDLVEVGPRTRDLVLPSAVQKVHSPGELLLSKCP